MVIEFIVAAVLFFSLILYTIMYMNFAFSEYRGDFYTDDLQSRAIQVSDMLMHDRVSGISGGYPLIDGIKVAQMQINCLSDYPDFLRVLDLMDHRIKIQLNNSNGNLLMDCGPDVPENATKVDMTRFGVLDQDKNVILKVWVW